MFDNFPLAVACLGSASFTPASLFAAGEQGAWYDPSDFSTMFQDAAGTTPVTATGQPVGLVLDKSRGLSVGPELATSPDLAWDGTAATDTAAIGPVVSGRWYRISWAGLSTSAVNTVNIRVGAAAVTPNTGVATSTAPNYTGYFLATATGTVQVWAQGPNVASVGSYSSVSLKEISGNHAYQSTAASRPVLQQETTGQYYFSFDGTDDSLSTGSIDLSSTNKVSVFAGLRKLSDAAQGIFAEFTADLTLNNGGFCICAPESAATNFNFASRGTTKIDNIITPYTSPITAVITGLGDIGAPSNIIRLNGSQIGAAITTSQGTGNYSNSTLNIGRRGGATLPFNGRLYSLIVRGASSDTDQISKIERWVNSKTGAF